MALYVFITDDCMEDARRHNRHNEMMALKEKVEKAQRVCHFDNFPVPYLKKRFERQIRLVADHQTIHVGGEDHVVVRFLRMYVRSSDEYGRFIKDPQGYGERYLAPIVDTTKVESYIADQLREHPVPPKEKPSAIEHHFLYRFLGQDQIQTTDEIVCESARWVQGIGEKKIEAMLLHLSEALPALVGQVNGTGTAQVRDCWVVYRWFPTLCKLFLAGVARDKVELEELATYYDAVLGAPEAEISEETLLQYSARTYPAFLLLDEEAWMDIQKDKESNLALSPEETRVLESVHSSAAGFPTFINGRAGSGKSTILYYLFADYVSLYLELAEEEGNLYPPLLLSCSDDLRRRSEEVVTNLIQYNPRWQQKGEDLGVPSECFQEFRSFLRALLSPAERMEQFPDARYIGYAEFRRRWQRQFGRDKKARALGPDISWHVIRTYIKGTSPDDYLDPEEYECVHRKQRTVSDETFRHVYNTVWEGWYQALCEDQGYWDDQDLARFIFDEGRISPVYPAVFCDEAQDFTRVELDLIFGMCLFADRTLTHNDIARVPFAFAGDPFQTLNPTGFRWDAIQALFHEKLVDTLGENRHKNVKLNYQELELNYRSSWNIVRLCNFIQMTRAAVFDMPELQPQRTWQRERNSPMPVWIDRDRTQDWEMVRSEGDVMLIVPCMMDEETEYVQNDPKLREIVKTDEMGVPVNVLSPTRAKGLEFGRVVLYGFSDSDELKRNVLDYLEEQGDADRLLPFEYFMNRLYVAASRPKRRLFIIDTQSGRDRLWSIANDETLQAKLMERIPNGKQKWGGYVGGFVSGNADSWSEDRGNPEENAERFMNQGLAALDPFLLRSAAMLYENIGRSSKSLSCKAHALRIEGKLIEAGEHFQRSGDSEQALECYWNAGTAATAQMTDLHRAFPDLGTRIEIKLFAALSNPTSQMIVGVARELASLVAIDRQLQRRLTADPVYAQIIGTFSLEIARRDSSEDEVRQFLTLVETLRERGLSVIWDRVAELHYSIGQFAEAVDCWERSENPITSKNYRRAKASLLARNYEESATALTEADARLLGEYFVAEKRFLLAASCFRQAGAHELLLETLPVIPMDENDWQGILVEYSLLLASRGDWPQLLELALLDARKRKREPVKGLLNVVRNHATEMRNALVVACALHVNRAPANAHFMKNYTAFFNKVLSSPVQWRDQLSVHAAGGAIEFTGRIVDMLRFYEGVANDPHFSPAAREYAWQRWTVAKEKQATRESEHNNERAARKYGSEAESKRREYGWSKDIDELPKVTMDNCWVKTIVPAESVETEVPVETPTEDIADPQPQIVPEVNEVPQADKPGPASVPGAAFERELSCVEFSIGDLDFEYVRERGRVNIKHRKTFEMASIRADVLAMRSSDVTITQVGDERFSCPDWHCTCDIGINSGCVTAVFAFDSFDLNLTFRFLENSDRQNTAEH